jgi:hypothetical protein
VGMTKVRVLGRAVLGGGKEAAAWQRWSATIAQPCSLSPADSLTRLLTAFTFPLIAPCHPAPTTQVRGRRFARCGLGAGRGARRCLPLRHPGSGHRPL